MTGGGWIYGVIFVASASLSLLLTPLLLRYAVAHDVLDLPQGHKKHESPVPYLGGLAIVLAFALAVAAAAVARPPVGELDQLVAIIGLGVLLSFVGLADDLWNLHIGLRLFFEIAAAVLLAATGVRTSLFDSSALDVALTTVWVVGITNALNLLDNMDGLSAGVAAIAAGWIFIIAAVNGQFLVAGLSIALAGCAVGFLRHNFHPAQIYMGDAGSLFLGFTLAALGIKLRFAASTNVTVFVPLLVLATPLFDTALVSMMRLLHGRSPLSGGRDHISHRLVAVGIPVPAAVGLIYAASVAFGWSALIMSRLDTRTAYLLMGLVLSTIFFVAVLLALVPVYESSRRRLFVFTETERKPRPPDPTLTRSGA